MCINHGGLKVFMSKQCLNSPYISTRFKQMAGKTVAQGMNAYMFIYLSFLNRLFKCPTQCRR